MAPTAMTPEHDDAHGAGSGEHGRHGEDAGPDDAADDQTGGRGQAQGMSLLLIPSDSPTGVTGSAGGRWRGTWR